MNSFGRLFRVSIFGESHGDSLGIIIDGCPAGLPLDESDFTEDINRRKPGQTGTTLRLEEDKPQIISGLYNGKTTGAPILLKFDNQNIQSEDYNSIRSVPRPGHADFTSRKKYGGYNDQRGSGQFSGRMTLPLVAAGTVAKKLIAPVKTEAAIIEIGGEKDFEHAIEIAIKNKDSIGGIIECCTSNLPVGLGEPFFDSVESLISHIIFSIPAINGIEFGSGFKAAQMTGSMHNDILLDIDGKTQTNNTGGINGGITNGNDLVYRVSVKPASSISQKQKSINFDTGENVDLEIKGRHDVCIALRIPVIIEAVTAIVLADLFMLEQKIPRVLNN